MITADLLTTQGYQKYHPTGRQYATALYQKRIDDEQGKRYFVNVYEYGSLAERRYSYEGDAQFVDGSDNTFNVQLLHPESVEQVEEFFESVWKNLGCKYYE